MLLGWLRRFRYTLILLALFGAWIVLRPDGDAPLYELAGNTMGTGYRVQLASLPDSIERQAFAREIQSRLDRLDRELMSIYAPDSQISRFNRADVGEFFPVAEEVARVVQQALAYSELTAGHFDITVAPLVELWGFGDQPPQGRELARIPSEEEIASRRRQVDYRNLEVSREPPGLTKTAELSVDLGGIAKGYAADALAGYFDSLGLESYFIEIGGELRIRGRKPGGENWVPAIERPEAGTREVFDVIIARGESIGVAGSGDYRNYFMADGERYSHEIDPFSGRPVQNSLAAVYVIAPTAMEADALTTAFMAMGGERGRTLAEQENIAAYFIERSDGEQTFETMVTPAFEQYLEQ